MSKQYLAQHTIDNAHRVDIYALAVTPTQVLSGSGESAIKIFSTTSPEVPLTQTLKAAHKLGCHHLTTSHNSQRAVSVGFGGEVKIWKSSPDQPPESQWQPDGEIDGAGTKKQAGEIWAVALSAEGQYLAATTYDGRINVWDLLDPKRQKIREYETKGSFGLCVDLSPDGHLTASGHASGSIYLFSNDTGRLLHSLPSLVSPVRTVSFSPLSTLLAAAGDSRAIALYESRSGEQIAHLTGHQSWITGLSWSATGEYLVSGGLDGKVKVWSVERRECVATHSESEKAVWGVKWLPRGDTLGTAGMGMGGRVGERFVTAGGNGSIAIYREAAGG